jgi:hypothetical protein
MVTTLENEAGTFKIERPKSNYAIAPKAFKGHASR